MRPYGLPRRRLRVEEERKEKLAPLTVRKIVVYDACVASENKTVQLKEAGLWEMR